jgi:hypothetical protein
MRGILFLSFMGGMEVAAPVCLQSRYLVQSTRNKCPKPHLFGLTADYQFLPPDSNADKSHSSSAPVCSAPYGDTKNNGKGQVKSTAVHKYEGPASSRPLLLNSSAITAPSISTRHATASEST